MNLFSKSDSKTQSITNILLLTWILISFIMLIATLITTLLPEGGDYSNFNGTDFTLRIVESFINMLVVFGTLFFINRNSKLFNITCFTKKLATFCLLFSTTGLFVLTCSTITEELLMNNGVIDSLQNIVPNLALCSLALYFSIKSELFSDDKSKTLNGINFVLLFATIISLSFTFNIILDVNDYASSIDLVRNILLASIGWIACGIVLILINVKK